MEISKVMHPTPISIGNNQTLKVALEHMSDHNIRHLPVKEAGKLIGILTDRDINFALRFEHKNPEELKVRDAFMADLYVVTPTTDVAEVATKMAHNHYGCALVVDKDELVGIFTAVDACRLLAEVVSGKLEQ